PASFDFDVGLVDAPGPSSWPSEAVPAFLEFWRIVLNPTHDRRVRQGESTFGHHLHEITKAEFVAQIPAYAEDDYFAIEMAAFEEFVHVEHSSALSFEQSAGKLCGVNPVRTRAVSPTGARDAAVSKYEDAAEIQFSSRPGPESFQSRAASHHPAGLQAETLDCIGGVARTCHVGRRLRAGVSSSASVNPVTLTTPSGGHL